MTVPRISIERIQKMSSIVIPSSVWLGHLWKMLEPTLRTLREPVKNWAADSMLNRAGRVLPQERQRRGASYSGVSINTVYLVCKKYVISRREGNDYDGNCSS